MRELYSFWNKWSVMKTTMSKAKNYCGFFSLLSSPPLVVLFKVRTWTSAQYTKRLSKRDYFEPQQLSSTVTKAVSRGNRRTSKLSFLVSFTISSYTWAKILIMALLGFFFSPFSFCSFHFLGTFGMSNWLLRDASAFIALFPFVL